MKSISIHALLIGGEAMETWKQAGFKNKHMNKGDKINITFKYISKK